MSNSELTSILFLLLLLAGLAQLFGWLFVKLRQPKVIGEILAGVVLGNAVVGRWPFADHFIDSTRNLGHIFDFVYWLGLLLLMFLAGAETQQIFTRDERREVGWLAVVGTGIPFLLGLSLAPWLIRPSLAGPNGNRISLTIVLAVGVAVTSVPVVSKIFADLKILHTRFARLVLGVAVLEDIALWLALAIATATAGTTVLHPGAMSYHLLLTVAFFILGLTIIPRLIKLANKSRFNVLASYSPTGYAISVLLAYCAVAGALDISLVFAAFLAGFAVVHKKRRLFAEGPRSNWKSFVRFLHPCLLRHRWAKAGLDSRGIGLDDARVHRWNLRYQDSFRFAGRSFCGLSWSGSHQSRDYHQCARWARNRPGKRGLRRRHYQFDVLHDAGRSGGSHVADRRGLAGLRIAKGLAAANSC